MIYSKKIWNVTVYIYFCTTSTCAVVWGVQEHAHIMKDNTLKKRSARWYKSPKKTHTKNFFFIYFNFIVQNRQWKRLLEGNTSWVKSTCLTVQLKDNNITQSQIHSTKLGKESFEWESYYLVLVLSFINFISLSSKQNLCYLFDIFSTLSTKPMIREENGRDIELVYSINGHVIRPICFI